MPTPSTPGSSPPTPASAEPPELSRLGRVALVGIVCAALASSILMNGAAATAPENLAIGGLGLAFLALLVGVGERLERLPAGAKIAYFAAQLALGAAILLIQARLGSFGSAWLLLMPLLVQGMLSWTRRGVAVLSGLALLLPTLHALRLAGPEAALEALVGVGAAIVFVLLFSAVTARERRARAESERLTSELAEANRGLAELAVQAEELAASRERNRLAREIHDAVGHGLTVASVQIEAAAIHLADDPEKARGALDKAVQAVRQGLAELRRSVGALRAGPLEGRSLPEVLEGLRAEAEAEGMEATVEVLGVPRPIPTELGLALYRAAQEGLTNVRKHAGAGRVAVTLDYRVPAEVALAVTDDGVGPRGAGAEGFGLLGLRERVRLHGGALYTGPSPGGGFELRAVVPA